MHYIRQGLQRRCDDIVYDGTIQRLDLFKHKFCVARPSVDPSSKKNLILHSLSHTQTHEHNIFVCQTKQGIKAITKHFYHGILLGCGNIGKLKKKYFIFFLLEIYENTLTEFFSFC